MNMKSGATLGVIWLAAILAFSAPLARAGGQDAESKAFKADATAVGSNSELTIAIDAPVDAAGVIAIDGSSLISLTATVTNTSDRALKIVGVGSNPVVFAPSDQMVAPHKAAKISVLVAPSFSGFPISASIGAIYRVDGGEHLRFARTQARLAPKGSVVPFENREVWCGADQAERALKITVPTGVKIKDVIVEGPFVGRVEDGTVYVRPNADKGTDRTRGSALNGSLQLIVSPKATYRLAPILLATQPGAR